MGSLNPDAEATELCRGVSIRHYRELVATRDGASIADLIQRRFRERYIDSISKGPDVHGFSLLAIGCLMVEALESFRQGWDTTDRRSEAAFCGFFQAHDEFADLRPLAHEFYKAVRCGILHQAETTHSWRVNQGPTLVHDDADTRWISGREFLARLGAVLDGYCGRLKAADWESAEWSKARKKLRAVCKNAGVTNLNGLS
jgi:hypothetical protein